MQVTLGGAPLYYFIGDEAAGDDNGQGLNDVWYLASAEGTPVGDEDEPGGQETPCAGRYLLLSGPASRATPHLLDRTETGADHRPVRTTLDE